MARDIPLLIHEDGKIDIHGRKTKYIAALAKLEFDQGFDPRNRALILNFLH